MKSNKVMQKLDEYGFGYLPDWCLLFPPWGWRRFMIFMHRENGLRSEIGSLR